MREIKFKALLDSSKEWVHGHYYNNMEYGVNQDIIVSDPDGLGGQHVLVDGKTLCQFTGLKDKNGKEIYEGDIVRHYSKFYEPDVKVDPELFENDETGTIQFKDGCFGFISLNGRTEIYGALETNEDTLLGFEDYWFEVIGNIHTNPELLGVKP